MRHLPIPAWAQFSVCVLVWGGSWIAIRAAVEDADPIGVAAYRTLLAVPLLIAVAAALRLPRPRFSGAWRAMLIGTVFIGVNFALVYWSAPRLPAGFAALVYATTPLQAGLLSPLFGNADRLTRTQIGALALGPLGIGIAFGGFSPAPTISLLATVAVFLAALTSAAGTVMARRWSTIHPVWTNVYANIAGSMVLWGLYLASPHGSPVPQSPTAWIGFLYMLLGGSVLAFAMYFMLVRTWDASRAAFTTLTTPFVALIAGFAILQEPIHLADVVGALIVLLAGVLLLRGRAAPLTSRRGPGPAPGTVDLAPRPSGP